MTFNWGALTDTRRSNFYLIFSKYHGVVLWILVWLETYGFYLLQLSVHRLLGFRDHKGSFVDLTHTVYNCIAI